MFFLSFFFFPFFFKKKILILILILIFSLGHTLTFLFLGIFSWKLKKLSLLFQFSRKFFPKMEINVCPKGTH